MQSNNPHSLQAFEKLDVLYKIAKFDEFSDIVSTPDESQIRLSARISNASLERAENNADALATLATAVVPNVVDRISNLNIDFDTVHKLAYDIFTEVISAYVSDETATGKTTDDYIAQALFGENTEGRHASKILSKFTDNEAIKNNLVWYFIAYKKFYCNGSDEPKKKTPREIRDIVIGTIFGANKNSLTSSAEIKERELDRGESGNKYRYVAEIPDDQVNKFTHIIPGAFVKLFRFVDNYSPKMTTGKSSTVDYSREVLSTYWNAIKLARMPDADTATDDSVWKTDSNLTTEELRAKINKFIKNLSKVSNINVIRSIRQDISDALDYALSCKGTQIDSSYIDSIRNDLLGYGSSSKIYGVKSLSSYNFTIGSDKVLTEIGQRFDNKIHVVSKDDQNGTTTLIYDGIDEFTVSGNLREVTLPFTVQVNFPNEIDDTIAMVTGLVPVSYKMDSGVLTQDLVPGDENPEEFASATDVSDASIEKNDKVIGKLTNKLHARHFNPSMTNVSIANKMNEYINSKAQEYAERSIEGNESGKVDEAELASKTAEYVNKFKTNIGIASSALGMLDEKRKGIINAINANFADMNIRPEKNGKVERRGGNFGSNAVNSIVNGSDIISMITREYDDSDEELEMNTATIKQNEFDALKSFTQSQAHGSSIPFDSTRKFYLANLIFNGASANEKDFAKHVPYALNTYVYNAIDAYINNNGATSKDAISYVKSDEFWSDETTIAWFTGTSDYMFAAFDALKSIDGLTNGAKSVIDSTEMDYRNAVNNMNSAESRDYLLSLAGVDTGVAVRDKLIAALDAAENSILLNSVQLKDKSQYAGLLNAVHDFYNAAAKMTNRTMQSDVLHNSSMSDVIASALSVIDNKDIQDSRYGVMSLNKACLQLKSANELVSGITEPETPSTVDDIIPDTTKNGSSLIGSNGTDVESDEIASDEQIDSIASGDYESLLSDDLTSITGELSLNNPLATLKYAVEHDSDDKDALKIASDALDNIQDARRLFNENVNDTRLSLDERQRISAEFAVYKIIGIIGERIVGKMFTDKNVIAVANRFSKLPNAVPAKKQAITYVHDKVEQLLGTLVDNLNTAGKQYLGGNGEGKTYNEYIVTLITDVVKHLTELGSSLSGNMSPADIIGKTLMGLCREVNIAAEYLPGADNYTDSESAIISNISNSKVNVSPRVFRFNPGNGKYPNINDSSTKITGSNNSDDIVDAIARMIIAPESASPKSKSKDNNFDNTLVTNGLAYTQALRTVLSQDDSLRNRALALGHAFGRNHTVGASSKDEELAASDSVFDKPNESNRYDRITGRKTSSSDVYGTAKVKGGQGIYSNMYRGIASNNVMLVVLNNIFDDERTGNKTYANLKNAIDTMINGGNAKTYAKTMDSVVVVSSGKYGYNTKGNQVDVNTNRSVTGPDGQPSTRPITLEEICSECGVKVPGGTLLTQDTNGNTVTTTNFIQKFVAEIRKSVIDKMINLASEYFNMAAGGGTNKNIWGDRVIKNKYGNDENAASMFDNPAAFKKQVSDAMTTGDVNKVPLADLIVSFMPAAEDFALQLTRDKIETSQDAYSSHAESYESISDIMDVVDPAHLNDVADVIISKTTDIKPEDITDENRRAVIANAVNAYVNNKPINSDAKTLSKDKLEECKAQDELNKGIFSIFDDVLKAAGDTKKHIKKYVSILLDELYPETDANNTTAMKPSEKVNADINQYKRQFIDTGAHRFYQNTIGRTLGKHAPGTKSKDTLDTKIMNDISTGINAVAQDAIKNGVSPEDVLETFKRVANSLSNKGTLSNLRQNDELASRMINVFDEMLPDYGGLVTTGSVQKLAQSMINPENGISSVSTSGTANEFRNAAAITKEDSAKFNHEVVKRYISYICANSNLIEETDTPNLYIVEGNSVNTTDLSSIVTRLNDMQGGMTDALTPVLFKYLTGLKYGTLDENTKEALIGEQFDAGTIVAIPSIDKYRVINGSQKSKMSAVEIIKDRVDTKPAPVRVGPYKKADPNELEPEDGVYKRSIPTPDMPANKALALQKGMKDKLTQHIINYYRELETGTPEKSIDSIIVSMITNGYIKPNPATNNYRVNNRPVNADKIFSTLYGLNELPGETDAEWMGRAAHEIACKSKPHTLPKTTEIPKAMNPNVYES